MSNTRTSRRELFGGTIIANLRSDLIDASDIRQIPDTQEVLLDPSSNKSFILEVLQRVEPADYKDAIPFRLLSTRQFGGYKADSSYTHRSNDRGDEMPSPVLLDGTQTVKKFNTTVPDQIRIFMALYRIESKNVDLVLTMNVPIHSADDGAVGEEGIPAAQQEFEAAALSLRILNFQLFA